MKLTNHRKECLKVKNKKTKRTAKKKGNELEEMHPPPQKKIKK
jgi:hypothetical protein